MNSIHFRRVGPDEAELVHRLMQRAFAEYASFPNPSSALSESVDDVRQALRRGEGVVATLGNEDIGSGRFTIDIDGSALIYERLAIIPKARGRGFGRAMVHWLEDLARSRGLSWIRCSARSQQPDNREFYKSMGYRITGFSDVYGVKDLKTHLEKALD